MRKKNYETERGTARKRKGRAAPAEARQRAKTAVRKPHIPDEVDHALLHELQQNARVTNLALAQKVGLTEGAVRRRIDIMLTQGALRIVGVGDPEWLGLRTHVVIGMRVEVPRIGPVLEQLAQMREFSYVYQTTGQFDIMAVAFFRSTDQLRNFLTLALARIGGIIETQTFLIMKTAKRSFRWGEAAESDAVA